MFTSISQLRTPWLSDKKHENNYYNENFNNNFYLLFFIIPVKQNQNNINVKVETSATSTQVEKQKKNTLKCLRLLKITEHYRKLTREGGVCV